MAVMTTRRRIVRIDAALPAGAAWDERGDDLTVESPLNLVIDGQVIATLMRTPGHDLELAAGWLAVESGVRHSTDLIGLRQCRTDDDVAVRAELDGLGRGIDQVHLKLAPEVTPPEPRAWVTGASCGVCSADILDLRPLSWAVPARAEWTVAAETLRRLPDDLRKQQRTFARTGSLHAAGLAEPDGTLVVVREDVGRHNAVDKVNGWSVLLDRLPLTDHLLVVSGRVSFEIVQKAVAGAVAGIVAVSAPSDLAVDLAREHGLLLAGMVRGDRVNLYSGAERVTTSDR
ncbi:MAG: formate dehydrogenase [Frankiales bacterium]|nr:formate dehydrogenase [Frankiales bacterium]